MKFSAKGQPMPEQVLAMGKNCFSPDDKTVIYWLGGAGYMVHSHNTNIMVDPVLEGFDMPLLIEPPILAQDVPTLNAVCVTHIDNDHFSRPTCKDMKSVCREYHAPQYVAQVMQEEGLNGFGHDIHSSFSVGDISVTLTPALHNWQNGSKKWGYRVWREEDYCGFWMDTPDGSIWTPGDSKLLEEQLQMPQPDVILFDFSDNDWHITFEGAVKLANAYPNASLLCIHWGTVDAPDWSTFNGNPDTLRQAVQNPERVFALNPGEPFILSPKAPI